MRRTLFHHARLIWRREGVELSTLTSRPHHRTNQMKPNAVSSLDTPLGILGLLAAGDERPNPAPRKVGVSSQAICMPNNVAVPEERLGEPGHLPLQSSSSLKLPLGQWATPCAQGSTQVRQVSWVPQVQSCSLPIQSASHGLGVGGVGGKGPGLGGWEGSARWSGWGKVGGLGEGLCQPRGCARALESSLNLCLRLEQCQECSHPLRKKKSTFLASCLNPTVQPLANPH